MTFPIRATPKRLLSRLARVFLGLIFILAGFLKAIDVYEFSLAIINFDLFPRGWTALIAFLLPPVEMAIGLLLLTGTFVSFSSFVSSILLFSFTGLVAITLWKGNVVPCNCFGFLDSAALSEWTIARNLLLFSLSAMIYVTSSNVGEAVAQNNHRNPIIISLVCLLLASGIVSFQLVKGNTVVYAVANYSDFAATVKSYRPARHRPEDSGNHISIRVKEFPLEVLQSKKTTNHFTLNLSDSPYKVVILFSTDDCSLCLQEAFYWQELSSKYRHLCVIGVGTAPTINHLASFAKESKMSFPLFWDPSRELRDELGLDDSPIRMVVDQRWKIIHASKATNIEEHKLQFSTFVDSCLNSIGASKGDETN